MTAPRPNIVFILTDDQGPWAAGCYGNAELRTPNLDRIAASGMRFANFFCASPVCSPSRASFLTGLMPSAPVAGGGQLRPLDSARDDGASAFMEH